MGVQGLWELLAPVGRRVSVEALANKTVAVDASIWLVQFLKAMRDERGELLPGAHLLGFLRRVCKLLFLRIRPLIVFDGATPALKRRTVLARRRQRENAQINLRRTAEKLLLNQLRLRKLEEAAKEMQQRGRGRAAGRGGGGARGGGKGKEKVEEVVGDGRQESGGRGGGSQGAMAAERQCGGEEELRRGQEHADALLAASLAAEWAEQSTSASGAAPHVAGTSRDAGAAAAAAAATAGGAGGGEAARGEVGMEGGDGESDESSDEDDLTEEAMALLPEVASGGGAPLDPAVLASLPPSLQLQLMVQMREQLVAENRHKFEQAAKAPAAFSSLQVGAYLRTAAMRRQIDSVRSAAASAFAASAPAAAAAAAAASTLPTSAPGSSSAAAVAAVGASGGEVTGVGLAGRAGGAAEAEEGVGVGRGSGGGVGGGRIASEAGREFVFTSSVAQGAGAVHSTISSIIQSTAIFPHFFSFPSRPSLSPPYPPPPARSDPGRGGRGLRGRGRGKGAWGHRWTGKQAWRERRGGGGNGKAKQMNGEKDEGVDDECERDGLRDFSWGGGRGQGGAEGLLQLPGILQQAVSWGRGRRRGDPGGQAGEGAGEAKGGVAGGVRDGAGGVSGGIDTGLGGAEEEGEAVKEAYLALVAEEGTAQPTQRDASAASTDAAAAAARDASPLGGSGSDAAAGSAAAGNAADGDDIEAAEAAEGEAAGGATGGGSVQTYRDEQGRVHVSRVRGMGVRMTRDLQWNLVLMREREKERAMGTGNGGEEGRDRGGLMMKGSEGVGGKGEEREGGDEEEVQWEDGMVAAAAVARESGAAGGVCGRGFKGADRRHEKEKGRGLGEGEGVEEEEQEEGEGGEYEDELFAMLVAVGKVRAAAATQKHTPSTAAPSTATPSTVGGVAAPATAAVPTLPAAAISAPGNVMGTDAEEWGEEEEEEEDVEWEDVEGEEEAPQSVKGEVKGGEGGVAAERDVQERGLPSDTDVDMESDVEWEEAPVTVQHMKPSKAPPSPQPGPPSAPTPTPSSQPGPPAANAPTAAPTPASASASAVPSAPTRADEKGTGSVAGEQRRGRAWEEEQVAEALRRSLQDMGGRRVEAQSGGAVDFVKDVGGSGGEGEGEGEGTVEGGEGGADEVEEERAALEEEAMRLREEMEEGQRQVQEEEAEQAVGEHEEQEEQDGQEEQGEQQEEGEQMDEGEWEEEEAALRRRWEEESGRVEREGRRLRQQKRAHERDAASVTSEMLAEVQVGVPSLHRLSSHPSAIHFIPNQHSCPTSALPSLLAPSLLAPSLASPFPLSLPSPPQRFPAGAAAAVRGALGATPPSRLASLSLPPAPSLTPPFPLSLPNSFSQELLQQCGVPYIIAPMEAEAQCAWLAQHGVVDAVVSDDCDALLFGAPTLWRHLFSDRHYVEVYRAEDVQRELGLSKRHLGLWVLPRTSSSPSPVSPPLCGPVPIVRMASPPPSSGSGIGVVNAIEVIHAFPGARGLQRFHHWLDSPHAAALAHLLPGGPEGGAQGGAVDGADGWEDDDGWWEDEESDEEEGEEGEEGEGGRGKGNGRKGEGMEREGSGKGKGERSGKKGERSGRKGEEQGKGGSQEDREARRALAEARRREFEATHAGVRRQWVVPGNFPSPAVAAAFNRPHVDRSTAPPSWHPPDLPALRQLCVAKLGMAPEKADALLLPVVKAASSRQTQQRLEAFYSFKQRFAKIRSRRVQRAVTGIAGSAARHLMLPPSGVTAPEEDDANEDILDAHAPAAHAPAAHAPAAHAPAAHAAHAAGAAGAAGNGNVSGGREQDGVAAVGGGGGGATGVRRGKAKGAAAAAGGEKKGRGGKGRGRGRGVASERGRGRGRGKGRNGGRGVRRKKGDAAEDAEGEWASSGESGEEKRHGRGMEGGAAEQSTGDGSTRGAEGGMEGGAAERGGTGAAVRMQPRREAKRPRLQLGSSDAVLGGDVVALSDSHECSSGSRASGGGNSDGDDAMFDPREHLPSPLTARPVRPERTSPTGTGAATATLTGVLTGTGKCEAAGQAGGRGESEGSTWMVQQHSHGAEQQQVVAQQQQGLLHACRASHSSPPHASAEAHTGAASAGQGGPSRDSMHARLHGGGFCVGEEQHGDEQVAEAGGQERGEEEQQLWMEQTGGVEREEMGGDLARDEVSGAWGGCREMGEEVVGGREGVDAERGSKGGGGAMVDVPTSHSDQPLTLASLEPASSTPSAPCARDPHGAAMGPLLPAPLRRKKPRAR
ncbi:unnamed protein product [Closterium sp. NIES-53]